MAAKCAFCDQESKYTCPKCSSKYCSLACFKAEIHTKKHEKLETKANDTTTQPDAQSAIQISAQPVDSSVTAETPQASAAAPSIPGIDPMKPSVYDTLVKDDVIRKILSYKSTKTHLKHLATLLRDSRLARESTEEGRLEVANMGLMELRAGGEHENETIEEFCQRSLQLLAENEAKMEGNELDQAKTDV